jgi:hypothetical protein
MLYYTRFPQINLTTGQLLYIGNFEGSIDITISLSTKVVALKRELDIIQSVPV